MPDTDRQATNQLGPPPLPEVTRLNRNVLLVAGMTVGVVILAVMNVTRSDTPAVPRQAETPVEPGAMGSFLREPVSADGEAPVPPPAYPGPAQGTAGEGGGVTGAVRAPDPFAAGTYDPYPAEPQVSPREEAYQRALGAGLRSGDRVPGREEIQPTPVTAYADDLGGAMASSAPGPYPGLEAAMSAFTDGLPSFGSPGYGMAPGVAGGDAAGASGAPQVGDRYEEFLAAAAESQPPTYIASRLEEPMSPYQIMAGTLLPAMLVTGINSDLPGEILAQITRNVYDSQQRFLLIPRGAKIIGRYDDQVALGQSRVLIAWTRLILPDGRSLSLPGLPTQDLRGNTGLRDKVDNHYRRLYGQATLLSIIGAGAQLSQPQQGSVFTPPSAGQVAAGALGQELSRVSMETIRRNMDVRPTLQVRPGTPFYIFLERDIVLEGAYADAG
jgi:type IV secretion system protein VirB10